MKIQLKDVLFNEPFWHTEEYAKTKANMTHYCFKITKSYNGERFVDYTSSTGSQWSGKSNNEVWVNRDESKMTVVLSDPMTLHCLESAVDTFVVQGRYSDNILHMSMNDGDNDESLYIVLSAEDEDKLRQYLLERAGLVAITLEENKDRIVMRNNHEGFVEEIVGLNAQLKKVSESAAPVKAKSRVVEINWGEGEGEDSAVQTPVRTEKEIQEPPTPVLMVEARLETLEKSITFRKEALANLSEDLYSSRITYLVELRAMDMLKTSLTSLLEDLEELIKPDEQIRQMDLNSKNDF